MDMVEVVKAVQNTTMLSARLPCKTCVNQPCARHWQAGQVTSRVSGLFTAPTGAVSVQVIWHPTKPTLLASCSMDGSVVAFQTDGSKLKVLQQSSPPSGCAWARDGYLLATTSDVGTVYV